MCNIAVDDSIATLKLIPTQLTFTCSKTAI